MDSGHGCRIKGGRIKFRSIFALVAVVVALQGGVPRILVVPISVRIRFNLGRVPSD